MARKQHIINYMEQPEERKKITNLLKVGNFKKVSGQKKHAVTIAKNRIITISLALVFIVIGLLCVFF